MKLLQEVRYYFRLTYAFTRASVKSMLTYKWSFVINCISQATHYVVTFLLMWVMISAFQTMNGWTQYEVMLLYAVSLLCYGLAGSFFFMIMNTVPRSVHDGSFDNILVKPVRVLPYLISSNFLCNYAAHIALSVAVVILCFRRLGIPVDVWTVLNLAITVLCGTLIYASFFLLITAASFLFQKVSALEEAVYFFREVSYYPLSIFSRFIQIVVTFFLPYGFVNFYPIQLILKKNDFLIFHPSISYLSLPFSLCYFILACAVFHFCAKRYKSTGS